MWSVFSRSELLFENTVHLFPVRDDISRKLCGEVDFVPEAILMQDLTHDDLAHAAVVDVSRVDVVDAVVDGVF